MADIAKPPTMLVSKHYQMQVCDYHLMALLLKAEGIVAVMEAVSSFFIAI